MSSNLAMIKPALREILKGKCVINGVVVRWPDDTSNSMSNELPRRIEHNSSHTQESNKHSLFGFHVQLKVECELH